MALFIKEPSRQCDCNKNKIKLPISSKNIEYLGKPLEYIPFSYKDKTVETILKNIDKILLDLAKTSSQVFLTNIGDGVNIYKGENKYKQLELKSLKSNKNIEITEGKDTINFSIDLQYRGNYNNIADALKIKDRKIGDTVSINEDGVAVEYWWASGVEDSDLIKKTSDTLTEEEHISDVVIGAIKPGDIIGKGTSVDELLEKLLTQVRYPTFVNPTFTSSNNAGSNREIGETFDLTITTTFNKGAINIVDGLGVNSKQNDRSGNASEYTIGGNIQSSNVRTFSVKAKSSNSYVSLVKYLTGPQPKDSKGNNFDLPLIAGELSSTTSFTAYYKTFYGSSKANTAPRTLTAINSNVNSITLNTGVVENQFDIYVIQSKSLSQVIDQDALNANITSQYVLQGNVNIPDGGGTNVSYKHYRMKQAVPYSSSHRHLITLT